MRKEYSMNVSDSRMIQRRLHQLNGEKQFEGFDRFIIRKMLGDEQKKEWESDNLSKEREKRLREEAYLIFYKKVKNAKVASRTTIRKWFGLDEYVRPKRRQMIKIAFALGLSEEELKDYLTHGILQPGIQINDYREMIVLYSLKQSISYEECMDMVEVFERHVYKDTVLAQNTHTLQLWSMFRENCEKPREEFLSWMCSVAGFFKGYSKVALRHFMKMKEKMLSYIRQDAREELFQRLRENTDFFEWAKENKIPEEAYGENVSRYMKNMNRRKDGGKIDDEQREEIKELNWMAYSSRDKVTDLLAELYASAIETDAEKKSSQKRIRYKNREKFNLPEEIFFMTDKYISQMIGIAQHKEKEIRMSQALGCLKQEEGVCPEWIMSMLAEYGIEAPEDAVQAEKLLQKLLRMQEQCCHLVQREDLLPLIHYVAQREYEQSLQNQNAHYRCENARIFFIDMADTILKECQMATVSEEYQLDYLLLSCYGKDYMYSLADVIEEAERQKAEKESV